MATWLRLMLGIGFLLSVSLVALAAPLDFCEKRLDHPKCAATTTTTTTTTTAPTTANQPSLYVYARSPFDPWTSDPAMLELMPDLYEHMVVWSPYFDKKLDTFPNGLEYSDVMAIYKTSSGAPTHPQWVLKDSSGEYVYVNWGCSGGTCPQYAADIGNPDFRAHFISNVLGPMAAKGYAGFHLDDVNMLRRFTDGTTSLWPVDPRTGTTMTEPDWREYMAVFTEEIRAAFPNHVISHNAIWYADSPTFDDPFIDRQIAAADLIQFERGINDGGITGGTGRYSMHAIWYAVDRIHRLGANVAWLDETGTTTALQERSLSAYFMTWEPGDRVSTEIWDRIAPDSIWSGYLEDWGQPLGSRQLVNGVWEREFEHKIARVSEPN